MRKLILTIMIFSIAVLAQATAAWAGMGGFSVTPVMPVNQDPETQGYYNLRVQPGQRQELVLTVNNTGGEDISVSLSLITATTNSNGIINYTDPDRSDETLPYSFAELAELSDEALVIPANSTRDVTIFLTVPDELFDGIILGATAVLKELPEEEIASAGMLVNQFRYVVAVRLQMTDNPVEPEFLLGGVTAELVNHRASIVADIRNPQPIIIKDTEVHAAIYPSGGSAIFERTMPSVVFAPNSVFSLALTDQAGYGIQAGAYIARIRVEHEDKTWEFEHEFVIEGEAAEQINSSAVNQFQQMPPAQGVSLLPTQGVPWQTIAAAGMIAAIVITLAVKNTLGKRKSYEQLQKQIREEKRLKMLEDINK